MADEIHNEDLEGSGADVSEVAEADRYRVTLPVFEGPLDLLLHLIKKHEVDILDIPVSFVTQKYLEYLDLMRVLNLDVAGEYLLMAATLSHLKSKMLLPRPVEAEDEEEELDPRGELVRRLLEYQKYKDAAERLASRQVLYRDVFPRAVSPEESPPEDAPLAELSVFQLLEAFAEVLERTGASLVHEVDVDRLSVTERIRQLVEVLASVEKIEFAELFAGDETRPALVVTFLAILEMARLKLVRMFQAEALGRIWITSTGVVAALPSEEVYSYRIPEPGPAPAPRPLTEEERALAAELAEASGADEDDDDLPPEY